MKTKITNHIFILAFTLTGSIMFSGSCFAQQKKEDQVKVKKTITIHVTKEMDGNTVVIDTTVVTDGDFDAESFLEEKGIIGNDKPKAGRNVEKLIIIRPPDSQEFNMSDSRDELPDTIIINDERVHIYSDKSEMPVPPPSHPGMPLDYNFDMHHDFPHMQGPQIETMLEDLARTFGLENVMPFGEMKQMVVKKKRNGKKVIITFEDREKVGTGKEQGNRNKQEKGIIYKNAEQGMASQNEEYVITDGKPGENIVIHKSVKETENGDQVIINAEVDNPRPVKKETRIIIIKEDGTK